MTRTGKGTTSTDVFAFGAFLLEVHAEGSQYKEMASDGKIILVDWVVSCWSRGAILETTDPSLVSDYITEEMELVLKLGLLCSHKIPAARPSMRQVVQFLDKEVLMPVGFDEFVSSSLHSSDLNYLRSSSVAGSVLSSGR
ncbi:hypothetical protein IFM89_014985 [Coptis chinensis]|uniref:Uncharacterized protein n=1 Tax=Coptis chinensis TaxID=261450 RepID=A0A835LN06_9MAGN|nr:hypothetical protein IFM89_014985 [Coptis chinensis]